MQISDRQPKARTYTHCTGNLCIMHTRRPELPSEPMSQNYEKVTFGRRKLNRRVQTDHKSPPTSCVGGYIQGVVL